MAELKRNGTNKVCAYSIDMKDYVEFGFEETDAPHTSWARYIYDICREIIKRGGKLEDFNTAFAGDVPLGAEMFQIPCFKYQDSNFKIESLKFSRKTPFFLVYGLVSLSSFWKIESCQTLEVIFEIFSQVAAD